MRVIDLSQTIEHGMPIYPGDPPVHIRTVKTIEEDGWTLKQLRLGSHAGTHVDAPAHMDEQGNTLDNMPLERFFGTARVVRSDAESFPLGIGLIFREGELGQPMLNTILAAKPPFVVTGDDAALGIALERALLKNGIVTFTDLINLTELPADKDVTFYGIPLKIKNGDGSPVRAFAIVEP